MILPKKKKKNQNIKIKLYYRTWMPLKFLAVIFQDWETSAASLTSVASAISLTSPVSTVLISQNIYWFWWLDQLLRPSRTSEALKNFWGSQKSFGFLNSRYAKKKLVWKKCPISNGNMNNEKDTDLTISRGFMIPVKEQIFKWQYIPFLIVYLVIILNAFL